MWKPYLTLFLLSFLDTPTSSSNSSPEKSKSTTTDHSDTSPYHKTTSPYRSRYDRHKSSSSGSRPSKSLSPDKSKRHLAERSHKRSLSGLSKSLEDKLDVVSGRRHRRRRRKRRKRSGNIIIIISNGDTKICLHRLSNFCQKYTVKSRIYVIIG